MSSAAAPTPSDLKLFMYMHDTAGKYHLHYSNIRTVVTTIVFATGILASINLLVHREQSGKILPILFIILMYSSVLIINMIFTRWSRACRTIERYYELKMVGNAIFNPLEHGFRHIFRRLILSGEYPRSPPTDFPNKITWNIRASSDFFLVATSIIGGIYIALYAAFLFLM